MRMNKEERLKNEILLNVQYFRLKEEISDTEAKIESIKAKKDFTLLSAIGMGKKKNIEHNQSFIDTVNNAIKDLEYINKKYDESIIDKNIAILKGCTNYTFLAYQIAVCTALDITVAYCNTDDYLEKLSSKLFGDKTIIASIIKKRDKILKDMKGTYFSIDEDFQKSKIINCAQIILNCVAIKGLLKFKIPKTAKTIIMVASMAINLGFKSGFHIFNKITGGRKFVNIDSDSLDYILVTNLLLMDTAYDLVIEKKLTELDYQKFFLNKMEIVERNRKAIHNDLYQKWKNRNENIKKMQSLCAFDGYVIKHLIPLEKR